MLLAAACGGDDDPAATPATTAAPATSSTTTAPATTSIPAATTTAPASEEDAILAAVDGFWQVLLEANEDPPDPNHPDLERFLTGAQLEQSRALVQERLELGQALRSAEPSAASHQAVVVDIADNVALVSDCGVDDQVLYDRASGNVLNDAVQTNRWSLTLTLEEGLWKVASSTIEESWDGVAGCVD
jgi:hypothetical protein